nr:DUF4258 domain-containing protein [Roseospira navarrensis]
MLSEKATIRRVVDIESSSSHLIRGFAVAGSGDAMSHGDETRRIRDLACHPDVRVRFTGHAEAEMRKDAVLRSDVLTALKRSAVVRVEPDLRGEKWNVWGNDNDGRMIEVVVVAYENNLLIRIVTVWKM